MEHRGTGPGVQTSGGSGRTAGRRLPGRRAIERSALQADVDELFQSLRQSIATIAALASAGQNRRDVSEEVRRLFADIVEQSRLAARMCRVVPPPTEAETFSLSALAERAALRARARFGADVSVHAEDVSVTGHVTDWRTLVDSLLEDACQAAGASGAVDVTVRSEGDDVTVEVSDSGSAYRRAHQLATAGLETAQRLAEHHGGRVSIGPSELGGASVRVTLHTTGNGSR